jgi:protein-S-isoprenylcysteine O-methyltransferase Ste14
MNFSKAFIPPALILYSIILIVLLFFLIPGMNIIVFPFNLLGILIAFSGFVIMGKTRDLFKKYNTTLSIDKSTHLINEGVFNKSRNPMYAGMFLLVTGIAICFGNLLAICIPFIFILIVSMVFIPEEEKLMESVFGQEFLDYRNKTRMWF